MQADVCYYAFGGGAGHVTRSIALLREIVRQGNPRVLALTNSRFAWLYGQEGIPHRLIETPQPDPDALAQRLQTVLDETGARVFVVDALPRGIFGEMAQLLPQVSARKALIARHLKGHYLASHAIPSFVDPHYDRVIFAEEWPGDFAKRLSTPCTRVPPIVVRDADEIMSRADARRALGVHDDTPLVLFASTSVSDEHAGPLLGVLEKIQRRKRTPDFTIRRVALPSPGETFPQDVISHFPLIELLPGADIVVGAAGYNLFYECQAVGVEAIFIPKGRLYDDQFWRAEQATWAEEPEHLEALLTDRLSNIDAGPGPPPDYANGAHEAAAAIASLL